MSLSEVFRKIDRTIETKNARGVPEWLFSLMESSRPKPPFTPDTYVTASRLHELCPRFETLRAVHDITLTDHIEGTLQFIFDVGTLYHNLYRNLLMGPQGAYVGKWKCLRCGWDTDGDGTDDEIVNHLPVKSFFPQGSWPNEHPMRCVTMPEQCGNSECRAPRFAPDVTASGRIVEGSEHALIAFDEWLMVNDEFRIRSKSDGWRRSIVMGERFNQEIKSISPRGFAMTKKRGAQPKHKTQCMVCSWMSGVDRGEVVYLNKAGYGAPRDFINPVLVTVDQGWLDAYVRQPVTQMRERLRAGTLAPRICASHFVERAKDCELCELCFKEAEG